MVLEPIEAGKEQEAHRGGKPFILTSTPRATLQSPLICGLGEETQARAGQWIRTQGLPLLHC